MARLQCELDARLHASLEQRWRSQLPEGYYEAVLQRLGQRDVSPHQAVAALLDPQEAPAS
jgi:hypothetical protein